jgi:hypothetical protein
MLTFAFYMNVWVEFPLICVVNMHALDRLHISYASSIVD